LRDITEHPDIGLTRGGLILIGLLSGGDYHQAGLPRCGTKIAHGLAKCRFGDSLYDAASTLPRCELQEFLSNWRKDLRQELLTNSQGHLGRKHVALARSVPDDFPDIDILLSYTNPITSETQCRATDGLRHTWKKEPDLGKLANICELYFEWGVKETIIKRFRTIIWPSMVLRILRRAVLDSDTRSKSVGQALPGSPSVKSFSPSGMVFEGDDEEKLVVKIHSRRTHASTDGILEYRLEVVPDKLVRFCEEGIVGIRPPIVSDEWAEGDEDGEDGARESKVLSDPLKHFRMWMPASIVQIAEAALVSEFECGQERKREKSVGRKKATKVKVQADENGLLPRPNTKSTFGKPLGPIHSTVVMATTIDSSDSDDDLPPSRTGARSLIPGSSAVVSQSSSLPNSHLSSESTDISHITHRAKASSPVPLKTMCIIEISSDSDTSPPSPVQEDKRLVLGNSLKAPPIGKKVGGDHDFIDLT